MICSWNHFFPPPQRSRSVSAPIMPLTEHQVGWEQSGSKLAEPMWAYHPFNTERSRTLKQICCICCGWWWWWGGLTAAELPGTAGGSMEQWAKPLCLWLEDGRFKPGVGTSVGAWARPLTPQCAGHCWGRLPFTRSHLKRARWGWCEENFPRGINKVSVTIVIITGN